MDTNYMNDTVKVGGYAALSGAITMIIGAVLQFTSGTDLWATLASGDMAGYLTAAGAVKGQLVANLSFWIAGVLILGVAGNIMASLCLRRWALGQVALVCIMTGVSLAIVAFIAMLALVVQIAPDTSPTAVAIANVVGWVGARADDLATALIIGATPFFLALAGRAEWMPTWLVRWGYLCGLVGLFSLVVLYIPPLAPFGLAIVPVGMGWMIAAGIALLRRGAKK